MLPFNLISELSRTLALAIRLFGNMMSGTMIHRNFSDHYTIPLPNRDDLRLDCSPVWFRRTFLAFWQQFILYGHTYPKANA